MVLRLPLVELLLGRLADLRAREHEDPGPGAVHPRAPRTASVLDPPGLVELGGVLSEVPDVAAGVLAEPLRRPFLEPPAQVEPILDDDARDAVDLPRPVGRGEDFARGLAVLHPAVDVGRAGPERVPRVVDAGAEIRGPRGRGR